ncbi:MAG: TIGR03619 family F420-dependent LLM class oxidoreductase [Candidatus Binatia bacterium]
MKFTAAINMCDPSHYLPLAEKADEAGWDCVAVPDSVFFPESVSAAYPYSDDGGRFWTPEVPFLEPWVVIPAMAAVTRRLRFYTHVLKLPIRQPLLVAKTVASAAVLSDNRVLLGVGLSWIPEEFKWLGEDYPSRGRRADEAIEIIRVVLAGGMVEYHGEYYDFDRLQMSPTPTERVPIIVGGQSRPALRRAARLGDGWCSANTTERQLVGYLTELRQYLAEYGREGEPFEIQALCSDVWDEDGFSRLESYGVTDCIVWPWAMFGGSVASLEDRKDALARFAERFIQTRSS